MSELTGKNRSVESCVSSRSTTSGASLPVTHPGIADEWHPTKNGSLRSESLSYGSGRKVWWRCSRCGYEWESSPANRIRFGCKPCGYKKVSADLSKPAPGRSFAAAASPSLLAEWHSARNLPLTSFDVSPKSGKKAWWKCAECQFEWLATIANRSNGAGCPECGRIRSIEARIKPPSGMSLADLYPEIASEWDTEKNRDITPFDVRPKSGKKVWWRCESCLRSWEASPGARSRGRGCPPCRRAQAGVSDRILLRSKESAQKILDRCPGLASDWHIDRNGDLSKPKVPLACHKKVWWKCAVCEFEWRTTLYHRGKGQGCGECANRRNALRLKVPAPGRSLADLHPSVASQWHPTLNGKTLPADVRPTSRDIFWWKDPAGHSWQSSVVAVATSRAAGCPDCTQWGTSGDEIRLKCELEAAGFPIDNSVAPEPYPNGRPVQCDIICPNWKLIIEFDGWYYHQRAGSAERDRRKTQHLKKKGWQVVRVREGLPLLASSDVRVEVRTPLVDRAKAVIRKAVELGFSAPGFERYLQQSKPMNTRAAEAKIRVHVPVHLSLAAKYSRIAEDWHPTLNHPLTASDVRPSTQRKVWWKCVLCEHEWETMVLSRTARGTTGCPRCRSTGRPRTGTRRPKHVTTVQSQPKVNRPRTLYRFPPSGQSLRDRAPEMAREWHPTKNGQLTPADVYPTTSQLIWWLCLVCGQEWQARPSGRQQGQGCTPCGRKRAAESHRVPPPGESFGDCFPELCAEWHAEKNGVLTPFDVLPQSKTKIWWQCSCGNEWRTTPGHRSRRGRLNCPDCNFKELGRRRSVASSATSISRRSPEMLAEWHPTRNGELTPEMVSFGSNKQIWWCCQQCGREWQMAPKERSRRKPRLCCDVRAA